MARTKGLSTVTDEEVHDIMGKPPGWVIRWGNVVLAGIAGLFLIGGLYLKFPETVSADLVLSSENPPVKLVAPVEGRISELDAEDGAVVEEGQIVAVVSNPAATRDMVYLEGLAERLDTTLDIKNAIAALSLPKDVRVGPAQGDYSDLYQEIDDFHFFNHNGYYADKMLEIDHQYQATEVIQKDIEHKAALLQSQLKLDKWKDSVNQLLVKEKVISPAEYNEIKKGYLGQEVSSVEAATSLAEKDQQRNEYMKSRSDLEEQYRTDEKNILFAVRAAAKKIKGKTADWEKQFVLRAPVKGTLTFFNVWKANQYVKAGDEVFVVVPGLYAQEIRAKVPEAQAGKIKAGQRVLIRLNEYPYGEYGMLKAHVVGVTGVAMQGMYAVKLSLDNGFRTTNNKSIDCKPEMTGSAEFVTDNKSVVQRVFERMWRS